MKPYMHAKNSAKKHGGKPEDYQEIHDFLKRSNNPREVEVADSIRLLERELPDDVMEVVFGDHVRIKATRKGFDVEEYSHD
jgi:hypothetical protein